MDIHKMLATLGAMAISVAAVASTPGLPSEKVAAQSTESAVVQAQQEEEFLLYAADKGATEAVNWHTSHASHGSHGSHGSHMSHSSHSSGYRW